MTIDDDRFEARLMSDGVYVTTIERRGDTLAVEYESIDAGSIGEVPHQEMGRVINVYRELVDENEGRDGTEAGIIDGNEDGDGNSDRSGYRRIEATVTDLEGEPVGTWHAEAGWLRALADDDLTEVEFSSRALDTIDHDVEN